MKAELGHHPFDGPIADRVTGLAQFLADDAGGGVRVQEAVADDLLRDQVGAAVVGFGASLLVLEGQGAALLEEVAQLEVALLGEAEFSGGGDGCSASRFSGRKVS